MKIKLQGRKVRKVYSTAEGEKLEVLKDIDFEIYENDFVSLVGPSGCGKTTLLRMIAGLEPITKGEIILDGKTIKGPSRERGMIFQQDAILPWRTVIKNVEYGLELRGLEEKKRREIAMKHIKLVDLESFTNYFPKELSGGMKKRVALAMVFANNPEIILCDEPFGSLDYPTKINLQKELVQIWEKEKNTLIFVTHDLEEALFVSNRILVVFQKKIVEDIQIPFSRPRTNELRNVPEFIKLKTRLWKYFK
ncbi:MAG TPA: ABC transporter ATP-binding protein [bacterium]|nr:ABC transporter ATP-binding protein [bacterium]